MDDAAQARRDELGYRVVIVDGVERLPLELHLASAAQHVAVPPDWTFRAADGRDMTVRVKGCVRSDNADVVLEAAMAGGGLVLAPTWQVRPHVAAGRLVPVLRGFEQSSAPIHAVYPHARLLSAKVRSFVDFLLETWRNEDFATLPRLNSGA